MPNRAGGAKVSGIQNPLRALPIWPELKPVKGLDVLPLVVLLHRFISLNGTFAAIRKNGF
jgi:hypothetical protein